MPVHGGDLVRQYFQDYVTGLSIEVLTVIRLSLAPIVSCTYNNATLPFSNSLSQCTKA